jgi:hypothetical protein
MVSAAWAASRARGCCRALALGLESKGAVSAACPAGGQYPRMTGTAFATANASVTTFTRGTVSFTAFSLGTGLELVQLTASLASKGGVELRSWLQGHPRWPLLLGAMPARAQKMPPCGAEPTPLQCSCLHGITQRQGHGRRATLWAPGGGQLQSVRAFAGGGESQLAAAAQNPPAVDEPTAGDQPSGEPAASALMRHGGLTLQGPQEGQLPGVGPHPPPPASTAAPQPFDVQELHVRGSGDAVLVATQLRR